MMELNEVNNTISERMYGHLEGFTPGFETGFYYAYFRSFGTDRHIMAIMPTDEALKLFEAHVLMPNATELVKFGLLREWKIEYNADGEVYWPHLMIDPDQEHIDFDMARGLHPLTMAGARKLFDLRHSSKNNSRVQVIDAALAVYYKKHGSMGRLKAAVRALD